MRDQLKFALNHLPGMRKIVERHDSLLETRKKCGAYPPGHYYSPLPDFDEVLCERERIFKPVVHPLPGIDMNEAGQLELLGELYKFYDELPFPEQQDATTRYYLDNGFYAYSDGILLYSLLRHLRPKRYVEVGSGFSSACVLDTRERFLSEETQCRFIDPNVSRLESLIGDFPLPGVEIVNKRLQDVPVSDFEELEAGDILFIDSSHVLKTGSDVHYYIFSILPLLSPGVYVHIHDIFYPFEYPEEWLRAGRAWNEIYAVRALLTDCSTFDIVLFNTYMHRVHPGFFTKYMPLCLKSRDAIPPGSIWLVKKERGDFSFSHTPPQASAHLRR